MNIFDRWEVSKDAEAETMFAAVRDLSPSWRDRAATTESDGSLSKEAVNELHDAGLLQIMIPRKYGGRELGWRTTLEASRIAARACPSTAWMIALVGGHAAIAARLPREMRERVFRSGSRQVVVTATPSSNGILSGSHPDYRLEGLWRYCSGIDHATWFLARCYRPEDQAQGSRPTYYALVEPSTVAVRDGAWRVMGMRGTGSKAVVISGQNVSTDMAVPLSAVLDKTREGPGDYVLNVPFRPYYYSLVIGPLLGCAEGALEKFLSYVYEGLSGGLSPVIEKQTLLRERVAEASAKLSSAKLIYRSIVDGLEWAGNARKTLDEYEQRRLWRDRAYLARLCVDAVQLLIRHLGTRATLEVDPVCRHWRDLQVIASHIDVDWDYGMQRYGEAVTQNKAVSQQ